MQHKSIRTIIICLFILYGNVLYSQDASITGVAFNENNEPLEYFDAVIRNSKDSTIIKAGAFIDGKFEFLYLERNEYILQLSSVGYLTKYINCKSNEVRNIDVGSIKIKSLILDEVKISAKRPMITRKDGNLLVDVKNSSLSNAGTSIDVLQKSPGVIVDNQNNVTVIGKGSPIIFINGKEVNSTSELELLQSNDIESVEIDRNPSAEYSASGHAVILITTKRITTDKLNILVFADSYLGRNYSNVTGFKINSKINKLSNYFSYSYSNSNNNQFIDAYENNYLIDDTIYNKNSGEGTYHRNTHNIFYGTSFKFNNNNIIGFQLLSSLSERTDSVFTNEIIENGHLIDNREIINKGNLSDKFYDLNLNYKLKIDSITKLYVIADYANKKFISTNNIKEQNKTSVNNSETRIDNNSLYNVFSARIDIDRLLFNNWKAKIGAKYSSISNDSKNNIESQNTIANTVTNSDISDQISASYFSVKGQLGKFKIKAGLRFEYTLSKTIVIDNFNDVITQEYYNFFPSTMFIYEYSEKSNISLSYSKRINRPSFNEINPKINYFDSLSYGIGNPFIKPTLSHNIELGLYLFKNFSVAFDYRKENDKRIQVATNDETNPHITKYIYENIDVAHFFSASISYNITKKKYFTNYSYLAVDKPYIKLPYFNTTRTIQKPIWYFQTNNEFIIYKNITFYINFKYESSGESDVSYWEESYNLSSGIYTKLFKKKLFLMFSVNDIFKTSTNAWHDKYLNIESGQITDNDTRWFKISLKYSFNQFNNIFDKKSSNEQDLNRL